MLNAIFGILFLRVEVFYLFWNDEFYRNFCHILQIDFTEPDSA